MSEQPHSERAHALLSASGASRWLTCTPSPRLEENFPEPPPSPYAEEGTLAHELAEIKLRSALMLADKEKSTKAQTDERRKKHYDITSNPLYSPEMETHTDTYVAYCMELYAEAKKRGPAFAMTETKVSLKAYIEDGFGTCDFIIVGGGTMDVIDLKYGAGLIVSADDNPQLKLYGLGAQDDIGWMYDVNTVRLHIVQPRRDAISTYEIGADALTDWGQTTVIPSAKKAYAGEGDQVTGSHCRWCKAQTHCRKFQQEAAAIVAKDFPDPMLLTDDEVLEAYKVSDKITSWLSKVSEFVFNEALAGRTWEGFKLVEGRSNRKWSDSEAVEAALTKAGYTQADFMKMSLEGIGAIEKLLGKKGFEEVVGPLTVKPPGKPALVPESDKRPPLDRSGAADFENLDEEI